MIGGPLQLLLSLDGLKGLYLKEGHFQFLLQLLLLVLQLLYFPSLEVDVDVDLVLDAACSHCVLERR